MAKDNKDTQQVNEKFNNTDKELTKIAILTKYNDIYRKGDTPVKTMKWNDLVKLKSDIKELGTTITKILVDDMINPSTFKVEKMDLEVAKLLSKHFDSKGIDLGLDGKKEQLAKKVITFLNSIYKDSIKESATSKQVRLIDIMDLFNAKGLDLPNIKNLDVTIKFSKAKISDLSEKAVDILLKKLDDKKEK